MNLLEKEITDIETIKSLLPQDDPFVMVDKLFFYSEKKIVSGFKISSNNLFVNNSIFEGPGLIENMAQTVALHTGYGFYLKNQKPPEGYIGAINNTIIYALPKVNDEITTTVEILHDIMGVTLVEAKVHIKDFIFAQSKMKTALAS